MRVVIKKAGQMPEVKNIKNELSAMQEIVGGNIEPIRMFDGVLCICNEDGKGLGLQPNFAYGSDIIVGDVFFCSTDRCDFNSLIEPEIEFIMNIMTEIEKARKLRM